MALTKQQKKWTRGIQATGFVLLVAVLCGLLLDRMHVLHMPGCAAWLPLVIAVVLGVNSLVVWAGWNGRGRGE